MDDTLKRERAVFEGQAELCKAMANASRIAIIYALKEGELTVNEIVSRLGGQKSNVSQHLSFMRTRGMLKSRKDKSNVYYKIANPKVSKACSLMREILTEGLEGNRRLASLGE